MFFGENIFVPFKNSLLKEIRFFDILSAKAKRLLISYSLQGAAYPLISTFINAYIWRSGENVLSVAAYNAGNFISLPLFFFINGLFLKKINLKKLYFLGAFLSAFSPILVVFYKSFNPLNYLFYGLVYGVGFGFYWANRNYLTLKETESENRNYFVGLNFSIDTATSILIPAATGWLLVLGEKSGVYTIDQSYKLMVIVAFSMHFLSGVLVLKDNYETPQISQIFRFNISKRWNGIRILTLAIGLTEGVAYFIPALVILTFLGDESVLGAFDSVMAIIILFVNYFYGRKARVKDQKKIFWLGLSIGFFASLVLLISQTNPMIITFLALSYIAGNLTWVSMDPFVMDVMDNENRVNSIQDYVMVFDRELFLNIGRVISVTIVALLFMLINQTLVLTTTYIVAYSIEIIVILIFWRTISGNSDDTLPALKGGVSSKGG